jgi:hypothetical protein
MCEAGQGEVREGHMGPFWPTLRLRKLSVKSEETGDATGVARTRRGVQALLVRLSCAHQTNADARRCRGRS